MKPATRRALMLMEMERYGDDGVTVHRLAHALEADEATVVSDLETLDGLNVVERMKDGAWRRFDPPRRMR